MTLLGFSDSSYQIWGSNKSTLNNKNLFEYLRLGYKGKEFNIDDYKNECKELDKDICNYYYLELKYLKKLNGDTIRTSSLGELNINFDGNKFYINEKGRYYIDSQIKTLDNIVDSYGINIFLTLNHFAFPIYYLLELYKMNEKFFIGYYKFYIEEVLRKFNNRIKNITIQNEFTAVLDMMLPYYLLFKSKNIIGNIEDYIYYKNIKNSKKFLDFLYIIFSYPIDLIKDYDSSETIFPTTFPTAIVIGEENKNIYSTLDYHQDLVKDLNNDLNIKDIPIQLYGKTNRLFKGDLRDIFRENFNGPKKIFGLIPSINKIELSQEFVDKEFEYAIKSAKKYGNNIYITEYGFASNENKMERYFIYTLNTIKRYKGYFNSFMFWSFKDNYEWLTQLYGFKNGIGSFGLILDDNLKEKSNLIKIVESIFNELKNF